MSTFTPTYLPSGTIRAGFEAAARTHEAARSSTGGAARQIAPLRTGGAPVEAAIARAAEATRGFLYVVGRTGVTGAATAMSDDASGYLRRARALAGDVPLGVGFGIRTAAHVAAVGEHAELAIVGSALVDAVHRAADQAAAPAADRAADRAAADAADPTEAAARCAADFIQGLRAPALPS